MGEIAREGFSYPSLPTDAKAQSRPLESGRVMMFDNPTPVLNEMARQMVLAVQEQFDL